MIYWKNIHIFKLAHIALLFLSLIIICCAYYIDNILGFDGCELCIYQRMPYYFTLFASAFCLIFGKKHLKLGLLLVLMAVSVGFIIAIYHVGVEHKFWGGLAKCSSSIDLHNVSNLEEYKEKLLYSKISDCSKPAFLIVGFSLAELNMLFSFALVLVLTYLIFKK
ncbi:MAG: disulfide bond formation protein B [Rickettsiaceae bacterium]|nr:disulfide bond formation protein B [Rickettsiaceae bacterium]